MSSPARPCSADGDDASDLARARGSGDDDRGEPPTSKRARTSFERNASNMAQTAGSIAHSAHMTMGTGQQPARHQLSSSSHDIKTKDKQDQYIESV